LKALLRSALLAAQEDPSYAGKAPGSRSRSTDYRLDPMKNFLLSPWAAVLACAALSTLADTLGTSWWEQKRLWMLLAILGLSPLVFLAFGYVGSHFGLAKASSLTNTLVVIGPILVGIIFRGELRQLSAVELAGIVLALAGIALLTVFSPREAS
jgi:drug/metabolite transporter (DMT)-like permease